LAKIFRHVDGREKVLFKEVLKMGKAAFRVTVSFLNFCVPICVPTVSQKDRKKAEKSGT